MATVATPTTQTPKEGMPLVAVGVLSNTPGYMSFGFQADNNRVLTGTLTQALTTFDQTILVSATAGNLTITLPANTLMNHSIKFMKTDASVTNTYTVAPVGTDTINGTTTNYTNTVQWAKKEFYPDGAGNWISF